MNNHLLYSSSLKNKLKMSLLTLFLSFGFMISFSFSQSCSCAVGTNIGNNQNEVLISQAVSTSSLSGSCLSITGTVVIDADFTLDNMEVIMNPGAELRVIDDMTLTVQGSHIHGCTHMWKSISLMRGATLVLEGNTIEDGQYAIHAMDFLSTVAGRININLKGNLFDKNYTSILALDIFDVFGSAWALDLSGNIYDCSGNLLPAYSGQSPAPESRSYAGWQILQAGLYGNWGNSFSQSPVPQTEQFRNLTNGIILGPQNIHMGGFSFTNIQADANSNYPLQGFGIHKTVAGTISVNSATMVNVKTGIFSDGGRINFIRHCQMDQMETGIDVRGARFAFNWIRNNTLSCSNTGINMHNNDRSGTIYIEPQRHIYENIIDVGVGEPTTDPVGIRIQGMVAGRPFEVWNNQITTNNGKTPVGITVDNSLNVQVLNNEITNQYLPGPKPNNYPFGIIASNTENVELSCNTISAINGSTSDYAGEGIQIIKCQNGTNPVFTPQISCNSISDLMRGVKAVGTNPGFIFEGNSLANYGQEGLKISDGATLESPTGFHDDSANQWSGNPPSWTSDARNDNPSSSAALLASRFKVHTSVQPYYPGTVDPPIGWFINDPLGVLAACSSDADECAAFGVGGGGEGEGEGGKDDEGDGRRTSSLNNITEAENLLPQGAFFDGSEVYEVSNWMRERQLYRKLVNQPDLIDDQLETYFREISASSIGQFEDIDLGLAKAMELSDVQTNELNLILEQMDQLMQEEDQLNKQIKADAKSEASSNHDQLNLLMTEYASLTQQLQAADDEILANRNNELDQLITQNNAIATSNSYEENEQLINDIYLNTIAKGIFSLDADQSKEVRAIAHLCLLEQGPAVLKARGLYQLIEQKVFVDIDNCQTSSREVEVDKKLSSNQISIFPNPASDLIEINFAAALVQDAKLIVSDAVGRQVQAMIVLAGKNKIAMNLRDLSTGIYFVTAVTSEGEFIATEKFIVNKE